LGRGEVAVEVKGSGHVDRNDLKGLEAFIEAFSPKKNIVVCNEKEKRKHGRIKILPWRYFLNELWSGKVL
jgi:predicted AAA+ superfamily ATPase